jgi:hypothetical protein
MKASRRLGVHARKQVEASTSVLFLLAGGARWRGVIQKRLQNRPTAS